MADSDYRAWVEVLPDFSQFNARVESAVVGGMSTAGQKGSEAAGTAIIGGVGKFAGPLAIAIGALAIGTALFDQVRQGIDASIEYTKTAVAAASDQNESINAVTVAYEDQAAAVLALGEDAPTSFGLTSKALNEFAVRFSGFAGKIAGDGGDVAGTLDDLLGRGTDFASVYNVEVADALALFQSGLAGETEPLRRYGVDLSAATVAAYAYANRIAEQGVQLTEGQRVQAAYGSLMQQTSKTQGDFANTSDELANSQRIMQAELDEVAAKFGTELLPVITEVMAFAKDELLPIWVQLNDVMGPALAAALEELWPALQQLWDEFSRLFSELMPEGINTMTLLAASLIAVAVMLVTGIEAVAAYAATWADFFALISGDLSLEDFVGRTSARMGDLVTNFNTRIDEMGSALGRINDIANGMGDASYNAGYAITNRMAEGLSAGGVNTEAAMIHTMKQIGLYLPQSPAKLGPFSGSGWDAIKDSGRAIMGQLSAGMGHIDVPLSASIVGTSPVGGLSAARADASVSPTSVGNTFNVSTPDPAAAAAYMYQQLGERLAVK